ncbi:MAG: arginase family protein [Candidatus Aenigmarchaeota archaeon]|nr:arginase family protein [Candidatus Aenigmarchaeota archaeon]
MNSSDALLRELSPYFIPPEKTRARQRFGGFDAAKTTFRDAKVIVYGVPFEGTQTYHAGSHLGPWAIRDVTGNQLEPFVIDQGIDPYAAVGVFDIGDFKLRVYRNDRKLIYDVMHPSVRATKRQIEAAKARVNRAVEKLGSLERITEMLRNEGKVPLMLGGEHLVSLWPIRGVSRENPVVLHFDAHMDMKRQYLGVVYSHTTPMYHVIYGDKPVEGRDFVQIGIRQASPDEIGNAKEKGVNVFYSLKHTWRGIESQFSDEMIADVKTFVREITHGRRVYVTFDMDVLDCPYVPFSGTPEPFGITPLQAYKIFQSIDDGAEIIGMDFVETSSDGKSTIEGAVASHLILRMLCHPSLRR